MGNCWRSPFAHYQYTVATYIQQLSVGHRGNEKIGGDACGVLVAIANRYFPTFLQTGVSMIKWFSNRYQTVEAVILSL